MLYSGPYTILNKDYSTNPFIEVKRKVKVSVLLSDQRKRMVIPSVANCDRFYALPIIHTPALVFLPIVFNIGNGSYKLARFLSQSLAHLTCNNLYTVINSYDFVGKLKLFPLTVLCFLLILNFLLLMFQFKGRWIAWKKG